MSNVTRRLAFYDLRDWWLSDERVRAILKMSPEDTFGPFFPAATQPESAIPYIRYDIDRRIDVDRWWIHTETVVMDIFTEDIEDSTELINILLDYSSQGDQSARDLAIWIQSENRQEDFEFHSIEYFLGGDMEAPVEQGGSGFRTLAIMIHYSPLSGRLIRI